MQVSYQATLSAYIVILRKIIKNPIFFSSILVPQRFDILQIYPKIMTPFISKTVVPIQDKYSLYLYDFF